MLYIRNINKHYITPTLNVITSLDSIPLVINGLEIHVP